MKVRNIPGMALFALLSSMFLGIPFPGPLSAAPSQFQDNFLPACGNLPEAGANPGPVLILIQGLDTSAKDIADQEGVWAFLTADLHDLYEHILYFSYDRDNPTAYEVRHTYESLWGHHIPLLHDLLKSCHQLGWQSFDIMGHSLGGVIASEYIKLYGLNSQQAGWVRHIITLDSPVNGSSMLALGDLAYIPWSPFALQSPAAQEMAAMSLTHDALVELNAQFAERLRGAGIEYWNLSNVEDVAVPPGDAIINEQSGRSYHLGVNLFGDRNAIVGHNQIFQSAEARDDICSILSTDHMPRYQCDFSIASGDVAALVAAINRANTSEIADTICLAAGTFVLNSTDNTTENGPNALPVITSNVTIRGATDGETVLERSANDDDNVPFHTVFEVSSAGSVKNGMRCLQITGIKCPVNTG